MRGACSVWGLVAWGETSPLQLEILPCLHSNILQLNIIYIGDDVSVIPRYLFSTRDYKSSFTQSMQETKPVSGPKQRWYTCGESIRLNKVVLNTEGAFNVP